MKAKSKNRQARADVLNGAMDRGDSNPTVGVKLKFPESFLREDGQPDELANYIHFRSKKRKLAEPDEKVYDIFLYIPDALTDGIATEYEEADKGLLEALVGKLTGSSEFGMSGQDLKQILIENAPGSAVIKQAAGKTVNPMKFQLFKGVNFREYSYDFMLRPKTEAEAEMIREIVHAFRISMLPGVSGENDRVYTFPNEWAIRFHGPFKDYIDYPLISVCTNVEVDYTGGQAFQAMVDGAPSAVSLKISFRETSTLNRKKYVEGVSAHLGKGSSSRETFQDNYKGVVNKSDAEAVVADQKKKRLEEEKKKQEEENRNNPAPVQETTED